MRWREQQQPGRELWRWDATNASPLPQSARAPAHVSIRQHTPAYVSIRQSLHCLELESCEHEKCSLESCSDSICILVLVNPVKQVK